MKFIIKLFPEITIKSQSVRLRFIKILTGNIRNVLKTMMRRWPSSVIGIISKFARKMKINARLFAMR